MKFLGRWPPSARPRLLHSLHHVQTVLGKASEDGLRAGKGSVEDSCEVPRDTRPDREEHGDHEGEEAPPLQGWEGHIQLCDETSLLARVPFYVVVRNLCIVS